MVGDCVEWTTLIAGVALNAAAQTSWRTMAAAWGMGAVPPAVMYAAALSCLTVAAASYGAMCGAEVIDQQQGQQQQQQQQQRQRHGQLDGDDGGGKQRGGCGGGRCCVALREIGARRLVGELCADEERVGAFVAGFVWNTALVLSCGPEVVEDWRWVVAFSVTFGAAAVNVVAELAGVGAA